MAIFQSAIAPLTLPLQLQQADQDQPWGLDFGQTPCSSEEIGIAIATLNRAEASQAAHPDSVFEPLPGLSCLTKAIFQRQVEELSRYVGHDV